MRLLPVSLAVLVVVGVGYYSHCHHVTSEGNGITVGFPTGVVVVTSCIQWQPSYSPFKSEVNLATKL